MKQFLLVFIIALVFSFSAYMYIADAEEMPTEPPINYSVDWKLNEVPNNISVYYDVNGDGVADMAYAHPIIKSAPAAECQPLKHNGDSVTLTWGVTTQVVPHKYTIALEPTMFKWLRGAGWLVRYESSCTKCLEE